MACIEMHLTVSGTCLNQQYKLFILTLDTEELTTSLLADQNPTSLKLIILREVEDKRDYHVLRLIDELKLDYKDRIRQIYRELSQAIHPSHKQIEQTLEDFYKRDDETVATVDCATIRNLNELLINVYDVFLILLMTYFPDMKKTMAEDRAFVNFIKKYEFYLVPKLLKE